MLKIFALLVALTPGHEPDKQAAFMTPEGPQICETLAAQLNKTAAGTVYTCEVE